MFTRLIGDARFDVLSGTSLQGYVDIAPAALVRVLGKPDEGDEYKVSGEYAFRNASGVVFTLYDWKSTTLYDTEAYNGGVALTPEAFWAQNAAVPIHIGGASKNKAQLVEFIRWLKDVVK